MCKPIIEQRTAPPQGNYLRFYPTGSVNRPILSDTTPAEPKKPEHDQIWHLEVPKTYRSELIEKIYKGIMSNVKPGTLSEAQMDTWKEYSRSAELQIFDTAQKLEAYYHMAREKVCRYQEGFPRRQKTEEKDESDGSEKEDEADDRLEGTSTDYQGS